MRPLGGPDPTWLVSLEEEKIWPQTRIKNRLRSSQRERPQEKLPCRHLHLGLPASGTSVV